MRGIQKQVVVLNDTGSELFEQVIFIVKTAGTLKLAETDMAAEAQRIVDGYVRRYYATQVRASPAQVKNKRSPFKNKAVLWTGIAGASAAGLGVLLWLLPL